MPPSPGSRPVDDAADAPPPPSTAPPPPSTAPPPPATATTLATDTLALHADAAAFCPTPGWRSLLAAGGYELDERTRTRAGTVRLYDTTAATLRCAGPDWAGPGVLDAAWAPPSENASSPLLALALADGTAALLGLAGGGCEGDGDVETLSLAPACPAVAVSGDEGGDGDSPALALAAAWQGRADGAPRLALSTSAGRLAVLALTPSGLKMDTHPWTAHSLEAWCVAWGQAAGPLAGVLLSGADDAGWKGWDVRALPSSGPPSLAFGDARTHGAGVTAIAPHPTVFHCVVTGSYDERARVWDVRSPRRPLCASTFTHAGGGVWRLRWHPADASLLLVAGMHAGFCILRYNEGGGGGELSAAETYPCQATLAYGCDWSTLPRPSPPPSPPASLVATASFYDNLVHLWAPATAAAWG